MPRVPKRKRHCKQASAKDAEAYRASKLPKKMAPEGDGLDAPLPETTTVPDPAMVPDSVIPQPPTEPEESWAVYGSHVSETDEEFIMSNVEDDIVPVIKPAIL
jgi:hypothetical protein